MSRSGLVEGDECDALELGRWRAAVRSAIGGKRGQAFLKETLAVLDAMPSKRLVAGDWDQPIGGLPFAPTGGDCCMLGAVGRARNFDMTTYDPEDDMCVVEIAEDFGIALALAREMVWVNDNGLQHETPEQRWRRVRHWVMFNINPDGDVNTNGN